MQGTAMESPSPYYSLVAYVTGPLGQFVEELGRELEPGLGHLPAHLTILPPRLLAGAEHEAVEQIESVCRTVEPFEITLGEVETFMPVTPTVFIRVAHAAYRLRELHDRLNTAALHFHEPWPYMPHLTILRCQQAEPTQRASDLARQRWADFRASRRITVERLTFVRQRRDLAWEDVAPVQLGRRMAPAVC